MSGMRSGDKDRVLAKHDGRIVPVWFGTNRKPHYEDEIGEDSSQSVCPSFAGKEDHIAPAESVWRITNHFAGPLEFLLAGSGHIAGVVNPPAANKYQYWTGDAKADSLKAFVEGAEEHPGSWWPHWLEWLERQDKAQGEDRPSNAAA